MEEIENVRARLDNEPENHFALMAEFREKKRVPRPNKLMDVSADKSQPKGPVETFVTWCTRHQSSVALDSFA